MVAGMATALLTCFGISTTASSNAIAPDNQTALLTIQGQGVNPHAKISLSTGPKQTIVTDADPSGQFIFSNLKYSSFGALNFTIDIPPFEKGLVKNYAANHLTFHYDPQEAMVSMDGKIGKSGTLAFNLGGAKSSIVQSAGEGGYVRLQTRTEQPMVSGDSALTASIINTAEICCPKMIVPNNPVTLTIFSQPIPAAPPIPVPAPQVPMSIPAVNMPVVPQPAPSQETVTPPVKTQEAPPKEVPYIIMPKKEGEQDKPKPKIPYIVEGHLEVNDMPIIVSDDIIAATNFPSSAYDATYVGGFKKVANEMLNFVLLDATAIGGFLDGRDLMNATRSLQLSTARTLKNYTPSDSICRFGTLSKSVALASENATKNQLGFSRILMDRNTQKQGSAYTDPGAGVTAMINDFRTKYCDKKDNNGFLEGYCGTSAATSDKLYNHDVDFTRVFDVPLTLNADFSDDSTTPEKSAAVALFTSLTYMPPLMSGDAGQFDPNNSLTTQDIRALSGMKNVAANSFAALVGQKAKSTANGSATYLNQVLGELGVDNAAATQLIGANPSYFAQMEVLTKKIFQSSVFYANLYESEANIDRQRVAMKAIELQQDRDFLESLRRREMLLSVLLNSKIRGEASKANESGTTKKR